MKIVHGFFVAGVVLCYGMYDDPTSTTQPQDGTVGYVSPSGDWSQYVGTYQFDDELFRSQNIARANAGKPVLVADIVILADGTFKRINGSGSALSTITGTVQATSTAIKLSPYRIDGQVLQLPVDKAVFNMELSEDGHWLQTIGKVGEKTRILRYRRQG